MTKSQGMPIRATIIAVVVLAAGIPAGLTFADQNHIPASVVRLALPAILLEALFYLSLAAGSLRQRWTPLMICLLAPLPLALAYGGQLWREPLAVIGLAAAAAWWFRVLPAGRATDFGFVLLAAAPILFKWFKVLYPDPSPRLDFAFMGQLMWIRVTALAVLNDRKPDRVGFGFWPRGAEWRTGLLWFAAILPAVLAVNALVGFADIGWPRQSPWRALALGAGTFFGILWVVALSEELIFRGLLQPWLQQLLRNRWAGLLAASLLFGAVHLGFREFPNWRFSALAAVAGVGYGLAYERAGSIRASMVAHAALVTVWRLFFR